MTYSLEKARRQIEASAARYGAKLSPQAVTGHGETLARLEAALDGFGGSEVAGAGPEPAETAGTETAPPEQSPLEARPERWSPGAAARLAARGGAYTWIAGAGQGVGGQGPLRSFPFAVKDLIAVAGRSLGAGSAVRGSAPSEPADAPIVARFRTAGAPLVGSTSLHEFAFGVTGVNAHTGTTVNPHDPGRIAGGSSTGSAVAVAERSARAAIGTDTGGSVRIPAALCGVVGFKPAQGTYPTKGVFPLSPTLDHVGFFTRNMADLIFLCAVLGGGELKPRWSARVGLLVAEMQGSDPGVARRLEAAVGALQEGGVAVEPVEGPDPELVFATSTAIMFAEAAAVHHQTLLDGPGRYGADVRGRLVLGEALSAGLYLRALHARRRLIAEVQGLLERFDCLLGPTVGMVAPLLAEATDPALSGRLVAFTRLANVVGLPALSIPVPGPGLPVGLQLTGRTDASVLSAAALIEVALLNR